LLHDKIDHGKYFAGRLLDDASQGSISPREILESNSLEYLKEKARIAIDKRALYSKWADMTIKESR
jgi:hypothetical protein